MSHAPAECQHNFTSWTTAERPNPAGDRSFYFEHRCTICGLIEETGAAIVEPTDFRYAREQGEHAEPDD